MRTWFVGLLALMIWIFSASSAFAQNAQITGSVKDSSGAIIPGATVTARNVDTGLTRVAVTDGSGEYRLPSLVPGRYSVASGEIPVHPELEFSRVREVFPHP